MPLHMQASILEMKSAADGTSAGVTNTNTGSFTTVNNDVPNEAAPTLTLGPNGFPVDAPSEEPAQVVVDQRYFKTDSMHYEYLNGIQDYEAEHSQDGSSELVGVTAGTRIVLLRVPGKRSEKDLWNHIHMVEPNNAARFRIDDGHLPPIDFASGDRRSIKNMNMKATWNHIDIAPTIMITLVFSVDDRVSKCFFEIPFTGQNALTAFKITHGLRDSAYVIDMEFTCRGGCYGEGHAEFLQSRAKHWNQADNQLYDKLCGMMNGSAEGERVVVEIWQFADDRKKSRKAPNPEANIAKSASAPEPPAPVPVLDKHLAKLFLHMPNTPESLNDNSEHVLESFSLQPYSAYLNSNGQISVQPGIHRKPYELMSKPAPAPMMTFAATNVFQSLTQYRFIFSEAVTSEYWAEVLALASFCNPIEEKHKLRLYYAGDLVFAAVEYAPFAKLGNSSLSIPTRITKGTPVSLEWKTAKSDVDQKAADYEAFFDEDGKQHKEVQFADDDVDDLDLKLDLARGLSNTAGAPDEAEDDNDDVKETHYAPSADEFDLAPRYKFFDEADDPSPDGWCGKKIGSNMWFMGKDRVVTNKDPREFELWAEMRAFCVRLKNQPEPLQWKLEGDNDMPDINAIKRFKLCMKRATEMIVAHSRIMCGTSDTVHGKLARRMFASGQYGAPRCIGVVNFKDEGAKITEPAFLGSFIHVPWARLIQMVVTCGDPKQLSPVVTSGNSAANTTNPARAQIAIPLMTRLINEGYPHVEFLEQARMNHHIVASLNEHIYDGKLRTALCKTVKLEDVLPGYTAILGPALVGMGMRPGAIKALPDRDWRVKQFVVYGTTRTSKATGSKVNFEQIHWAVQHVLPAQQKYFGDQVSKKCMWISGYNESASNIEAMFLALRQKHPNLTADHFPSVYTINSSQGREAAHVLHITVCDSSNRAEVGFLKDDQRTCVARSRAQELFWEVSGNLGFGDLLPDDKTADFKKFKAPYLSKHYLSIERADRILICEQGPVADDQIPTYLREQE